MIIPSPSLQNLLVEFGRQLKTSLYCHQVGVIQSFDASKCTATVRLVMKRVYSVPGAEGTLTEVNSSYPDLEQVPVYVYSGGGSYISCPIAAGDECIVAFIDRDYGNWYVNGQVGLPPASSRAHDFSDAVAIVGLNSAPKAKHGGTEHLTIHGGSHKIDLKNDAATLKEGLEQLIVALKNWVDSQGHVPNAATKTALDAAKDKLAEVLA